MSKSGIMNKVIFLIRFCRKNTVMNTNALWYHGYGNEHNCIICSPDVLLLPEQLAVLHASLLQLHVQVPGEHLHQGDAGTLRLGGGGEIYKDAGKENGRLFFMKKKNDKKKFVKMS